MKRFACVVAALSALMAVQAQVIPVEKVTGHDKIKAADPQDPGRVIHLNVAPEQLTGGCIHYSSSTIEFVYHFAANGTYEEVWVHRNGTQPGHKTGTYAYTKTGPDTASLDVDAVHYTLGFGLMARVRASILGVPQYPLWFWETVN